MRFLFDQSTDRRLVQYLRDWGHDVTVIAADYPPSLPDEQVLDLAFQERRILVTEDHDFGEMVYRHRRSHVGVIYLRLRPMEQKAKVDRLYEVLHQQSESLDQFVVVTLRSIRVRQAT